MPNYKIPFPIIKDILHERTPPAPLKAIIHITTHCNLRCEFCWYHSPLEKEPPPATHAPNSQILNIIHELAQMGTKAIHLGADGEPTNHPKFIDFVEAIKRHSMHLHFASNFSFRSPKIAAACVRADGIIINLAAVDAASYQAIHTPKAQETFNQIIENIKFFSHIQARHGHPKLEIDFVITKNNFRYIEQAIELARSCGISILCFRMLRTTPETRPLSLTTTNCKELQKNIICLLRKPLSLNTNLTEILQALSAEKKYNTKFKSCFTGWINININQNGNVGLCCQNHKLLIGNWKEKTINEIWTSPKAQQIRAQAKNHFNPNAHFWQDCRFCRFAENNLFLEKILQKYAQRSN